MGLYRRVDAVRQAGGVALITSDHGNLEDLGHRHHTSNAVPTLIIGDERREFGEGIEDLSGLAGRIERYLAKG